MLTSAVAAVLLAAGLAGLWSHARTKPRVRTVNPEAYQSYLKANFEIERYDDRAAAERALGLYRAATEKDPEFAAAFAGMGAAYLQMMLYTAQPRLYLPQAESAARRAIELQPDLADGHIVLGRIRGTYQWDWKGAEEAFRRGLQLNPSNIVARNYYVSHLTMMGEYDKAIEFGRVSMELQPYSRSTATVLAQAYLYSGRMAETVELTERILKIDPSFNVMHRFRALALANSDFAGAMEEAKQLTTPDVPYAIAIQASIAGCAGDRRRALELRRELYAMGKTQYLRRIRMAHVEVCLGNQQQALDWLEAGLADHEVDMMTVYAAPWFFPLRGHPRYTAILRQMNFPIIPRS
jgi:tetratricopeptide (TPR) repeat protein